MVFVLVCWQVRREPHRSASLTSCFTVVHEFLYITLCEWSNQTSGVARSLVLARHLLYTIPLALRSHMLGARLCDMSGTNMVLWPGTCHPGPAFAHATGPNYEWYDMMYEVAMVTDSCNFSHIELASEP